MKLDSLLILHIILLIVGIVFISFISALIIVYVPEYVKRIIRRYKRGRR